MLPQPTGCRKCFPRFHWIPKHALLCYRNKSTYFLIGRNVFIIMVAILIIKDWAESSYNELKFMVQNNSNICTNLNSCLKKIKGRFTCGGNIMIRLLKSIIVCGNATWHQFSSVQSSSRVWLFMTPWITACQASLHHQLPEITKTHVHWVSDAI